MSGSDVNRTGYSWFSLWCEPNGLFQTPESGNGLSSKLLPEDTGYSAIIVMEVMETLRKRWTSLNMKQIETPYRSTRTSLRPHVWGYWLFETL